jgi:hypothetical protein
MKLFMFFIVILLSGNLNAQRIKLDNNNLEAVQVYMSIEKNDGQRSNASCQRFSCESS